MLFKIYKKEMIDSLRDKRTLLLTVFLPIIMMTALTFFYENMIAGDDGETYNLAVETNLSGEQEMFLESIGNVELITTSNPEQELSEGNAHAAVVFANDYEKNILAGDVGKVEIIGDTFSLKSSSIMNHISSRFAEYEQILVLERLQEEGVDPNITKAITVEQRNFSSEDSNVLVMLIPLILSIAIGVGATPTAADLFAGEKEKKTMEALLMTPVNRSKLLLAKYFTISSIGTIIGIFTLLIVSVEIAFFTKYLKASISFGDQLIPIISIGIIISIVYSFFMGSILMILSIIGKTVKEANSYISPIAMLAVFPALLISGLGVNELTMNHFILPFVNIFAVITELLFGVVNYEHIGFVIGSNVLYIILILLISRFLFSKDKWVMN